MFFIPPDALIGHVTSLVFGIYIPIGGPIDCMLIPCPHKSNEVPHSRILICQIAGGTH